MCGVCSRRKSKLAGSGRLAELLTGATKRGKLDESGREVINEVGNIVLIACLGSFGNMMEMNIKFTVPQVQVK